MINVNDNTILNPENVVIAEQKGSMYKLTLINGKTLYVNKDVYEDIITYEPVSKEYVDSKLSGALKRLIVQALPTEDIDTNTIYMVLDTESSETGNVYNEYLYINNDWELIGTTKASGPAYTAGTGIDITGNVISNTIGSIYQHDINIYGSTSSTKTFDVRFKIFNTSSTQFTKTTIGNVIKNLAVNKLTAMEANGLIADSSNVSDNRIIIAVYSDNGENLYLVNAKFTQMTSALNDDLSAITNSFANVNVRDDVRQIN